MLGIGGGAKYRPLHAVARMRTGIEAIGIHRRAYRFFPPTPGTAATWIIQAAICPSSRSSADLSSTPRVDLPIATGVTGGTGSSAAPFTNINLTWSANPPQQKHQPSPTP